MLEKKDKLKTIKVFVFLFEFSSVEIWFESCLTVELCNSHGSTLNNFPSMAVEQQHLTEMVSLIATQRGLYPLKGTVSCMYWL